jgi:hypothetical protein
VQHAYNPAKEHEIDVKLFQSLAEKQPEGHCRQTYSPAGSAKLDAEALIPLMG